MTMLSACVTTPGPWRSMPNDERIELPLAEEVAAAEALANAGDALAASRKFTEIAETFAGFDSRDTVDHAALRAGELLSSSAAKGSIREEKAAEKYESLTFRRIGEAAGLLRTSERPVAVGELRHLEGAGGGPPPGSNRRRCAARVRPA